MEHQMKGPCQDSEQKSPGYVMVTGLHKGINHENLLYYMEARTDTEVKDIIWGPSNENAVVIFEKKPDYKKLQLKLSERPLEGKFLQVIEMSPPTSIIVSSKEFKEFTTEALVLHFESKRHNGGEIVEEETQKTEEGYYIITFKDSDVAANVCTREHTIDKIKLNVSPFYRCGKKTAWNASLHEVAIPTPFKHPMDLEILKYIKSCPRAKEAVQTAMKNVHAAVELKETFLLLTCLLTPEVKDCKRLMASWRQDTEECLNKFLCREFKIETISIMSDILNDITRTDSDIMISEVTGSKEVQLIGFYDSVVAVQKELLEKEKKLMRQKCAGTDYISLKSTAKKRLLEKCGFLKTVKETFSDFDFQLTSEGIVLSGVQEDINSAKLQILEQLRQFDEPAVIHDVTEHFKCFIQKTQTRNYILHKMELMNYTVDWDVTERGQILIYGIPSRSAKDAADQIKRIVKESKVPLSDALDDFLTSEKWQSYSANGELEHDGSVEIIVENDRQNAVLIGTDGIYARVLDDLSNFLNMNTVLQEDIPINPIEKKFMEMFWKTEEIEKNSGDKHIKIMLHSDKLSIRGTKAGIQKAKELLKEKTSKLKYKSHSMKRVGIEEVLFSEEENGTLGALEKAHRCLICTEKPNLSPENGISSNEQMNDNERTSGRDDDSIMEEPAKTGPYICRNGLTIVLIKGQLAQEKVNAIVCATSPDLNLSTGAASKSLLAKGGMHIQKDCKTKYPEGIKEGDVVDIIGGNMNCDKVYLTVLPEWERSNDGKSLKDVVLRCLRRANDDSLRSIAFTAMGTGQLRYPKERVASLMYDACIEFDSNNSRFTLKDVHFVLYEKDEDTIKAFERQEINMLSGGARPKSSRPAPQVYSVGNVGIYLPDGEVLSRQQVDAILCSSARSLDLSKGVLCSSLLDVGGQSLQTECRNKYPNGIQLGQIAEIGGGNLKCKLLFLAALPPYTENGENVLFNVVTTVLQKAVTNGCKSLALPAMGTGYLKYPEKTVAKIMFEAVTHWARANPQTSLRIVRFILYKKDEKVVQAFRGYLREHLLGVNTKRDRGNGSQSVITQSGSKPCIIIYPNDDSACTVGDLNVRVCRGDLLEQPTDVIVNCVDEKFSFQDGVAALLRKRCPQGLEDTCRDKKNLTELRKKGVVITDSFGLKCKKIIHVKFHDHQPAWTKVILKCLEKANKHKLTSIAFPMLGTDSGISKLTPDDSAEMFFEALLQFVTAHRGHNLQTVNLVVHYKQPEFIPEIKKVMVNFSMKIYSRETKGKIGKFWERVKDFGRDVGRKFVPLKGDEGHQNKPTLSQNQMSTATVKVYSDRASNIDNCIKDLEKTLNKAYISKPLNDEFITQMSKTEFEDIFTPDLPVEFEFVEKHKQVIITGTAKNIVNAQDIIHKKLMKKAREKNEEREADQLQRLVQWMYKDFTSEELKPYDKLNNLRIENAYQNGQARVEIKDHDKVFIVDFKKQVQYSRDDESNRVEIMRKDIMKANICNVPETWEEMQENENYRRFSLPNQSQEYKHIERIFLVEATTGPYASKIPNVQNIQVVKIERIQNKTLYWQYSAKKYSMETQYKDNPNVTIEQKLWHGTPQASINSICTHGFNRSYCGKNGTWFGEGVYFATNASYSARSWLAAGNSIPIPGKEQFIFYVSVCVGQYVQGRKDMRVLPPKDARNPSDIYDSAVNDVKNVEEIVIFNDTQAYPEYLLTFTT